MEDEATLDWRPAAAGVVGVILVTATILVGMGRTIWCKCGSATPWSWDIQSMHNSQHILDAYTFTHILHGVIFFGVLHVVMRGRWPRVRLVLAAGIEGLWELVENSPSVIEHYRANTISLDYYGDSVSNSMADIGWCVLGFLIARVIPWWASVLLFITTELVLLFTIRDSLMVNVIMLIYPLEAIKIWQAG